MTVSSLIQDMRYAARVLRLSPGFTFIAIAALALGIGANAAIFSIVDTVLRRPLPYRNPDRLVSVWERNTQRDRKNNVVSPGNYLHWREMNHVFDDMAAISLSFHITMTGRGDPEEVPVQFVSASLFPILGVLPALGRSFTPQEDQPDSHVVVLSDRFWRRRLGGDPGVLNQSIRLDGKPYTILGVMPAGFSILDRKIDVWVPVAFSAESRTPRGRWLAVVGRLKNGVSVTQAQADMTRVAGDLVGMFPDFDKGWTARVVGLKEEMTGEVRPALFVMLGAVGFVLLIACANVANLLLARATARQRELAIRAALGADRRRLVRQLLAESLLLSALGGAAGLTLAGWALYLLRTLVADRIPVQRLDAAGLNAWVLAATCGAALLSGVVFGLVPALTAAGASLTDALKEGGRTGSSARGARTRQAFVVVEMALALVLLVGAGLLVRSFMTLLSVNPGFDPSHTVTMKLSLPSTDYATKTQVISFFDRVFERVDALAGVQAAGGTSFLPLNGIGAATGFEVVGQPKPPAGEEPVADVRVVTHDYFKAMGVPLLSGRYFDSRDTGNDIRRVIINETMARKYWPDQDPIGRQVVISWNDSKPDEIVGVVGDVRQDSLETEARATTYWPPARFAYPWMTVSVRTSGDAMSIAPSVSAAVHAIDANIPVSDIRPMGEVMAISVAQRRLTMLLLSIFAGTALLLAAVGIYGVISYTVTQRTQEIGIRMALGAQRGDVLGMVLGQAMSLAMIGIALGGAGAWFLTRLMQKLLFGVTPSDPVTFTAVAALLAAVAAAAACVPGLRATRVDPVIALRSE